MSGYFKMFVMIFTPLHWHVGLDKPIGRNVNGVQLETENDEKNNPKILTYKFISTYLENTSF